MSGKYRLNEEELESHYDELCSNENVKRLKKRFETKSDEKTSVLLKEYKSALKTQLAILNQGGDVFFAQDIAFNRVLWKYPREKSPRQYEDVLYKHLEELEQIFTKTYESDPNFIFNKDDSEKERVEIVAFAIEHFLNQKRKPTESEKFIVFCGFVYELKLLVLSQSDQFLKGQRFQIHPHERVAFKKSPKLVSLPTCWKYWTQLDKKEKDKILTQSDSGPYEYNEGLFFESYLKYLKKKDLMTTETTINVSKSETQGVLPDTPKKRPKEMQKKLVQAANIYVDCIHKTGKTNPTQDELVEFSECKIKQTTWSRYQGEVKFWELVSRFLEDGQENSVYAQKIVEDKIKKVGGKQKFKPGKTLSLGNGTVQKTIEKDTAKNDLTEEQLQNEIDAPTIRDMDRNELLEEIKDLYKFKSEKLRDFEQFDDDQLREFLLAI